jgi:hypothetical protein
LIINGTQIRFETPIIRAGTVTRYDVFATLFKKLGPGGPKNVIVISGMIKPGPPVKAVLNKIAIDASTAT